MLRLCGREAFLYPPPALVATKKTKTKRIRYHSMGNTAHGVWAASLQHSQGVSQDTFGRAIHLSFAGAILMHYEAVFSICTKEKTPTPSAYLLYILTYLPTYLPPVLFRQICLPPCLVSICYYYSSPNHVLSPTVPQQIVVFQVYHQPSKHERPYSGGIFGLPFILASSTTTIPYISAPSSPKDIPRTDGSFPLGKAKQSKAEAEAKRH